MGPNHPLVTTPPSSVNGDMFGNAARRAHATFSSATTCCCLLCPLLTVPCFAHKLAHMQAPGSRPSPAMPTQPWPPKPCKSRCGCRCRWLRESVGTHPITDVGNALTTLATIRLCAPGLGCSLGALKSWNGLGAESRARPWALKGTSCPNNGSPTLPRRASPQMTGGDSTWSFMERHRWEGPSAAMPHWSRRCPAMACPTEEQLHGMGPSSKWQNGPNGIRTLSSPKEAPKPFACGGRWNAYAVWLAQPCRAPPAVRGPAQAAWARRWWSILSVAVQAPGPRPLQQTLPALEA